MSEEGLQFRTDVLCLEEITRFLLKSMTNSNHIPVSNAGKKCKGQSKCKVWGQLEKKNRPRKDLCFGITKSQNCGVWTINAVLWGGWEGLSEVRKKC